MTHTTIVYFSLISFMIMQSIYAQCNSRPVVLGSKSYNTIFYSPNHPDLYPFNSVCEWNITVPSFETPTRIRLSFDDFETQFDVDFLRVYNGTDIRAPVLAAISGSSIPDPVYSTGPSMFIQFTSDATTSSFYKEVGFQAKINSDPACTNGGRPIHGTGSFILESPFYPSFYYNHAFCRWTFPSDNRYKLFTFTFDPFFRTECSYDSIDIVVDKIVYRHFCGSEAPPQWSHVGWEATVEFLTDFINVFEGFRLTVDVTLQSAPTVEPTSPTTAATTTSTTPKPAPLGDRHAMAPVDDSQKQRTGGIRVNGTIQASQTISSDCDTLFYHYLRQAGWEMLRTVNRRLELLQICDGDQWRLTEQEVIVSATGRRAAVKYEFYVSRPRSRSLDDHQACSSEISKHLRDHSNWPQPMLPALPECPTTTFSPAHFDHLED